MIDLAKERVMTSREVAQQVRVTEDTVRIWMTEGSGGVRLEYLMVGGSYRTTQEALQRFTDELTRRRRVPRGDSAGAGK